MPPMSPLVDASVASALISPDPVSYVNANDDEKTSEKSADKKNSKSEASAKKKESQEDVPLSADDRFYTVDAEKLQKLCNDKPWMKGGESSSSSGQQQGSAPARPAAKFFETLSVSPSAVTKMMMHCQSGVEKGISKGGNPIEGEWPKSVESLF